MGNLWGIVTIVIKFVSNPGDFWATDKGNPGITIAKYWQICYSSQDTGDYPNESGKEIIGRSRNISYNRYLMFIF